MNKEVAPPENIEEPCRSKTQRKNSLKQRDAQAFIGQSGKHREVKEDTLCQGKCEDKKYVKDARRSYTNSKPTAVKFSFAQATESSSSKRISRNAGSDTKSSGETRLDPQSFSGADLKTLQTLLSETKDFGTKRKIRTAIRELSQQKKHPSQNDVNLSNVSPSSCEPTKSSLSATSTSVKGVRNCGQPDKPRSKTEAQQNNANITNSTSCSKAPKEKYSDDIIIYDSKSLHCGSRIVDCSNPIRPYRRNSSESKRENTPLQQTAPHVIPVIVEIKDCITFSNQSKNELVVRNKNETESRKSDIGGQILKSVSRVESAKGSENRSRPKSSCIRNSENVASNCSSRAAAYKSSKRQQQINSNYVVHNASLKSKVKQKVGSHSKLCKNGKDGGTKSNLINYEVQNQLSPLQQSFKSEKLRKEIDLNDDKLKEGDQCSIREPSQIILNSTTAGGDTKCEINKTNGKITDLEYNNQNELKSVKTSANIQLSKHTCNSDSIVLQHENPYINIVSSGCNNSLHQDNSVATAGNGRQISRSDPHPNLLYDSRQEIHVNALHGINTAEFEHSGSINTICNAKGPADVTDGVVVPLGEGNSHSGFPFLRRDSAQIGSNISSKNNNCIESNSRNVTSTLTSAGCDCKSRKIFVTGNNSQSTLEITTPASIMSTSTDFNDNRLGLATVQVELQGKVDMEAAFSKLLETFEYRSDTSPSPCSSGGIADRDTTEEDTIGLPSANSNRQVQADKNSNIVKSTKCIRLKASAVKGKAKVMDSCPAGETKYEDSNINEEAHDESKPSRPAELALSPAVHHGSKKPDEDDEAITVLEQDDGTITIQKVILSEHGSRTVTMTTRMKRTDSESEYTEKDTTVLTELMSPGGSEYTETDEMKTRRKVTRVGSDYYQRKAAVTKRVRDKEGTVVEEQDISVEMDNMSVTQGKTWGDRTTTKIYLEKPADEALAISNADDEGARHADDEPQVDTNNGQVSPSIDAAVLVPAMFMSEMEDATMQSGSSLTLECEVVGSPSPNVTWLCNDVPIITSANIVISYEDERVAKLHIPSVQTSNGGKYCCVIENIAGKESVTAIVTVEEVEEYITIEESLLSGCGCIGQPYSLRCRFQGCSCPEITWYKDGVQLSVGIWHKTSYEDGCAKLDIMSFTSSDAGVFECEIRAGASSASSSCCITVEDSDSRDEPIVVELANPISTEQMQVGYDVQVVEGDQSTELGDSSIAQLGEDFVKTITQISLSPNVPEVSFNVMPDQKMPSTPDNSAVYESTDMHKATISWHTTPSLVRPQDVVESECVILHSSPDSEGDASEDTSKQLFPANDDTHNRHQAAAEIQLIIPESDGANKDSTSEKKPVKSSVVSCAEITLTPRIPNEEIREVSNSPASDSLISVQRDVIVVKHSQAKVKDATEISDSTTDNSAELVKEVKMAVKSPSNNAFNSENTSNVEPKKSFSSAVTISLASIGNNGQEKSKSDVQSENFTIPSTTNIITTSAEIRASRVDEIHSSRATIVKPQKPCQDNKTGIQPCESTGILQPSTKDNESTPASTAFNQNGAIKQTVDEPPIPKVTRRSFKPLTQKASPFSVLGEALNKMQSNDPTSGAIPKTTSVPSELVPRDGNTTGTPQKISTSGLNFNINQGAIESEDRRQVMGYVLPEGSLPEVNITVSLLEGAAGFSHRVRADEQIEEVRTSVICPGGRHPATAITDANMSTAADYESVEDEEELQKFMGMTEDFDLRKKIRAKIRGIREKKRSEAEEKQRQREKETEDLINQRYVKAEAEKQRKLKSMSVTTSDRESQYLVASQKTLTDKHKLADEEKKKKLEAYSRIAAGGPARSDEAAKSSTSVTKKEETSSDGSKTTTTVIKKTQSSVAQSTGLGGTQYGASKTASSSTTTVVGKTATVSKTSSSQQSTQCFGGVQYGAVKADYSAKNIASDMRQACGPGTKGSVQVRTEQWNNQRGTTNVSQHTTSWGGGAPKPAGGARGAMAAFKKMDSANAPAAGAICSITQAKSAATTLRNAVTIKQEILEFIKSNTGEYEARISNMNLRHERILLSPGSSGAKPLARSPSAVKQMLMDWCKSVTSEYENISVTNFSTCWNNGLAFCALIHHFYPDAFDYSVLNPKNRRYNFNLAFDTAEKCADIAPLLDVEDMVKMKNPDWKCVFTYVQSFYRVLRNHTANKAVTEQ